MVSWGLPVVDTLVLRERDLRKTDIGWEGEILFLIGIAGYGTGKSHLAALSTPVFKGPDSDVAQKILDNLALADAEIGQHVSECISTVKRSAVSCGSCPPMVWRILI